MPTASTPRSSHLPVRPINHRCCRLGHDATADRRAVSCLLVVSYKLPRMTHGDSRRHPPDRVGRPAFGVISLVLPFVIKRLLQPRNVWSHLARIALALAGAAFLKPFWQLLGEELLDQVGFSRRTTVPTWGVGVGFLVLSVVFAWLSARYTLRHIAYEALITTPETHPAGRVGKADVHIFCGSVVQLRNVDVAVSSENQNLNLGSLSGTSVSGRLRRLAAEVDEHGRLQFDYVDEKVREWKREQGHGGPYSLGTTIALHPPRLAEHGLVVHLLAVSLNKADGGNRIDESANRRIIESALEVCSAEGYSSLFIPVFGLGSGKIDRTTAINAFVPPLVACLRTYDQSLDIYVGTYRISDASQCLATIIRQTNSSP